MVMAFQLIMLVIMGLSFIGTIGEKKNTTLRNNLVAVCIASIFGFVIAELLF